ncbi:MAG: hypothetical protein J6Y96_01920 [Mycoplasma sp.]|nr:hypothetical protein [Mycoplasma sp.]
MICKNCGNNVKSIMSTWQIIFGVILIIIGCIIFGVLYMEFCSKTTCPVCNNNVYIKNTSLSNSQNDAKNKYQESDILFAVQDIQDNIENIK